MGIMPDSVRERDATYFGFVEKSNEKAILEIFVC